jgi:hypothetical protein
MLKKAVVAAGISAVTGITLMFAVPAFAASTPTPTPKPTSTSVKVSEPSTGPSDSSETPGRATRPKAVRATPRFTG